MYLIEMVLSCMEKIRERELTHPLNRSVRHSSLGPTATICSIIMYLVWH